ncbi:MAG: EAL domain-containing protein, partial [Cyanobacteria bacterium J06641_5]
VIQPHFQDILLPLVMEYRSTTLVALRADRETIDTSIKHDNLTISIATIAACATAVTAGLLLARSIAQPVQRLQALTERVGRGDFSSTVSSTVVNCERRDELGALTRAFGQMVTNLNATMVSRSYLDVVLNSMADGLFVIDRNGCIQTANQAMLDLLQVSCEVDLLKKSINEIADERVRRKIVTLFQTGQDVFCEATYLTRTKQLIAVDFSSAPLRDENGQITRAVCVVRDATDRRRAEQALRDSEERYALIAQATNDGLWDWDLYANQVYFSSRWRSMLGYNSDDAIGTDSEEWFSRIHSDERERVRAAIDNYIKDTSAQLSAGAQVFELEYPMHHGNGSTVWILCRGAAVRNEHGVVYRLVGIHTDLTESKAVESQLRHAAFHDTLTGLPNRSFFAKRLQAAFSKARTGGDEQFAVLFLDLDRFKVINDSLGHHCGDELLQGVARRLQRCLRDRDNIARLGGDEFAILLENIDDSSIARVVAERIQKALAKPFNLNSREVFASTSIGIVTNIAGYTCIDDILRDADTAMYQAKTNGKARYAFFDLNMHSQMVTRLHLENDLRGAIEREEFVVHYQPIIELRSRQIVGLEALVRWQHPERGLLSPHEFVPVAEETETIIPIGWWVLRQACQQLQQWQQQFPHCDELTVSVNLSGKQVLQLDSAESAAWIAELLSTAQLDPKCLQLEITESTIITNNDIAATAFKHLAAMGLKLAMDDFGTGYSSLSYLHQLQVQTLKVDRSFVNGIDRDSDKLELVRAIVSLANALELDVVAEGIETIAQQQILSELGCTHGQGFLWAKPAPAEEVTVLLAQATRLPPTSPSDARAVPDLPAAKV